MAELLSNISDVWMYMDAFFNDTLYISATSNLSNQSSIRVNESKWAIYSIKHLVTTCVILGVLVLTTIIGNAFVIAAVILEKNLHGVANYLVVSLAVADLMVASLVMPISVVNEVSTAWFFSSAVCDFWVSFDVLCCTASILHLLAISIDRYWAVTNIDYIRLGRSPRRIILMIVLAWIFALSISIPPLFDYRSEKPDPAITGECIISQDIGYTIFSTFGAFYLPMLIMMAIYLRIYQVARRTIRRKNFAKLSGPTKQMNECPIGEEGETVMTSPDKKPKPKCKILKTQESVTSIKFVSNDNEKNTLPNGSVILTNSENGDANEASRSTDVKTRLFNRQRDKLEQKRERKAARTLGIITGCFIICWLPFFIVAIILPFSESVPRIVQSITLWLGYLNSSLNPVIYTIFSPDFRGAFRKILCAKYRNRNNNILTPR